MKPSAPAAPLSERMRPKRLTDYVGQSHLIGPKGVLSQWIESGHLPSLILWGPPGVGKTTLAQLLADALGRQLYTLSAVHSGVKDLRDTLAQAQRSDLFREGVPLLFIDEIHRFSKSQQDALLEGVEAGTVRLIGATTENPGFEVIPALLSRCQVLVLKPHTLEELRTIGHHALETDPWVNTLEVTEAHWPVLARLADGDARRLLNLLEVLAAQTPKGSPLDLGEERLEQLRKANPMLFERGGDQHYDLASALIKSVRGSDPQAALYYLARLIHGGEDPVFIARRLLILSAEDIGLADPNALMLATSCFEAVERIGMPEARIPLAECCIYLASAPKSNSAYKAIDAALAEVEQSGRLEVPLGLRNPANRVLRDLGHGKNYRYPHDAPGHFVRERYLPEAVSGARFYTPAENEREQRMAERLRLWWGEEG